jgi:hypothetical protein
MTRTLALADADSSLLSAALIPAGQCRFVYTNPQTCTLVPFNGNQLLINGVFRPIPTVGIPLSVSGLSTNVVYYVYAYWNGAAIQLIGSTNAPVQDATYGIMIPGGTPSYTLVGMVYTLDFQGGAGVQFMDSPQYRCVASWFNRRRKHLFLDTMSGSTGSGFVEFGSRTYFLSWGEDSCDVGIVGQTYTSTFDNGYWYMAIDGTQLTYPIANTFGNSSSANASEWISAACSMGLHYHQLFARSGGSTIYLTHQKFGAVIL